MRFFLTTLKDEIYTQLLLSKRYRRFSIICLMVSFIGTNNCLALSLCVDDDSFVDSSDPSFVTNNDISTRKRLLVNQTESAPGGNTVEERIAYFKYKLDSLPDNFTSENLSKASIRLWIAEVAQPGVLQLHNINSAWDETTLNYDNRPTLSSALAVIKVEAADANGWLNIDITKQLSTWVNLPGVNFGIAITAPLAVDGSSANVVLSSKEGIYIDVQTMEANLQQALQKASPQTSAYHNKKKHRYCHKKNRYRYGRWWYKKYCGHHNDNDDDDNDDNGGAPTIISIDGTSGHPSSVEIAYSLGNFD